MSYFSRTSTLYAKIIGWLQIVGGIFGLFIMAGIMLRTEALNGALLLILLFGVALYIFSIHCGIRLLNSATRRYGIIVSLVNQGLQLLQFCIAGCGLSYSSGVDLTVGIKNHELNFGFHLLSSFDMSIFTDDPFKFCVNFFAIVIFIVLLQIYRKPGIDEGPTFDEVLYTDPEVAE